MGMETTTNKEMELAREAQRKYTREYRRAHPDKVKAWNARYWAKRARMEADKREAEPPRG